MAPLCFGAPHHSNHKWCLSLYAFSELHADPKKKIFVTLSKTATDASLASLVANATNLKLVWGPDATNKTYTWVVNTIDTSKSITGNAFEITFGAGGIPVYDGTTGTTSPGSASDTWPTDTPAVLRYDGDTLRDSDDNLAPSHAIKLEPWNLFHVN